MRIAIIDSSCLISLVHLDLASMLTLYFDVVYVPGSVQIECNRKHRSRYRLNKLFEAGVLQRCIYKDETRFRLLTVRLGPGEAEGLVQAQERGAEFFLVDERKAREIGERQGLTLYGTVGLLARFCLVRIRRGHLGSCGEAEGRARLSGGGRDRQESHRIS
jgi:predicted nucleic acid-binding protein